VVLVTTAFPKEVNNFSYINGILALPGKSNLRLKDVSTASRVEDGRGNLRTQGVARIIREKIGKRFIPAANAR
jgi:hypothetical protein